MPVEWLEILLDGGPLDGTRTRVPRDATEYQRATFNGYLRYVIADRQPQYVLGEAVVEFRYDGRVYRQNDRYYVTGEDD